MSDKLESVEGAKIPEVWDSEEALTSIAISLKRIADVLEALAKGHRTPESEP